MKINFYYYLLHAITSLNILLYIDPSLVLASPISFKSQAQKLTSKLPILVSQSALPEPNRERLNPSQPNPQLPQETKPVLPIPKPSQISPETELQPNADIPIQITSIEVVGSTVFTQEDFGTLVQPIEGKTVTLSQLNATAQEITKLYITRGYLTSRAIVPPQDLSEGKVRIEIIEGSIERIDIEGNKRLKSNYIRSRINLGVKDPLNINQLEDQLQLLQSSPLLKKIEARLQAGQGSGKSQLKVKVEESPSLLLGANVDNYTTPSTGPIRTGILFGTRNLTGYGDSIALSYNRSVTGGLNTFDANYSVPINAKEGTLQFRSIIQRNRITEDPFEDFDIESDSERYSLSFRQPLIRTPRNEFALSLGFSHQRSRGFVNAIGIPTQLLGPDINGVARTSVVQFGQDYTRRDQNGVWALRSQFNLGVDLGATTNTGLSPSGKPIPDGRFFSWSAQAQRVQRLSQNNLLIIQADLQLTPDSLLPSEQFTIGGAQSVRGYRQNSLSGDNGFRFSIEDRIALAHNQNGEQIFQLSPFIDMGVVFNSNNPNQVGENNFIIGLGLGLLWEPLPGLNLRLDYAPPIIDLNRGDDIQDHGFFFSLNYQR